jgi:hypothetical protein
MSLPGEIGVEIDRVRARLLKLMAEAHDGDEALGQLGEALKKALHRQNDLKSSITMTLDSLDLIEAKLRGQPANL